jgi:hypothetical protein
LHGQCDSLVGQRYGLLVVVRIAQCVGEVVQHLSEVLRGISTWVEQIPAEREGFGQLDDRCVDLSSGAGTDRGVRQGASKFAANSQSLCRSSTHLICHRLSSRSSPAGTSTGWEMTMNDVLHPEHFLREGGTLPAALVLPNGRELTALAKYCPRALPRAVVAGDPCFDRMLASRPMRRRYRKALWVRPRQRLVVISTTWSRHSLFGQDPRIFARVMSELPPRKYQVVAVLHPFVWQGHGRQQVLAWLTDARAAGMVVLPPEEGWRAALVAADLVLGDHGSVLQYAAALGAAVLMNAGSLQDVRPGSTAHVLSRCAPPLDLCLPLLPQMLRAMDDHDSDRYAEVAALVSASPGQSARILRTVLYSTMGLAEPASGVRTAHLPLPVPIRC